jgi:hypothetical protein
VRLHASEELGELLGAPVVGRRTIHEWPLSCVQELRLADGGRWIYKAQLPPTVEPEFYATASSPLLVRWLDVGSGALLLEFVDAPTLTGGAEAVVRSIGEIEGEVPVYVDVGTAERWEAYVRATLEGAARAFPSVDVEALRAWALAHATVAAVIAAPRLAHGDLTPAEVFVVGDGHRVVDWQRPVRGPAGLDLVTLAPELADPLVARVFWFLRLGWAVTAEVDGLVPGASGLFRTWARDAAARVLRQGV